MMKLGFLKDFLTILGQFFKDSLRFIEDSLEFDGISGLIDTFLRDFLRFLTFLDNF